MQMWWKFWTWFRHDDAHQRADQSGAARSGVRAGVGASAPQQTEDILTSLSGLIDVVGIDPDERRPATDTYDAIRLDDLNEEKDETGHDTWAGDSHQDTHTSDTIAVTDQPPTTGEVQAPKPAENKPAAQHKEPPPRRPEGSKGSESQKTLVAEDGKWPGFKGLNDMFSDLDDDDDADGSSPMQTIVPHDD
jgi:hypothetical protein